MPLPGRFEWQRVDNNPDENRNNNPPRQENQGNGHEENMELDEEGMNQNGD